MEAVAKAFTGQRIEILGHAALDAQPAEAPRDLPGDLRFARSVQAIDENQR